MIFEDPQLYAPNESEIFGVKIKTKHFNIVDDNFYAETEDGRFWKMVNNEWCEISNIIDLNQDHFWSV